jgi:endonuclease/exonuclease/phosphatase family metal-dependent hydrolase
MNRCVRIGVRVFGAAALLVGSLFVAPAAAQTTVVLDNPGGEVVDAFIRAGSYANVVYNTSRLVTKSNSDASFRRRALLKFDTQNFVPANARIQSATLTLTLARTESSTRTLGAYRVASSFDEFAATWYRRKSSYRWTSAGGDLGSRYASATVGTSVGSRVSFNVTTLVQDTVNGRFGSRYTRIALLDLGASSSSSLKEFHSSEASDPSVRPRLTVVYGGSTSTSSGSTGTSTSSTLKVLHWNIHYGIGTDGRYGMDKYVDWIVRINPDIVSLNEVEKYVSGHGNENQPAILAARLSSRTGRRWYYHHVQRYCGCVANGGGNLILSRFPLLTTAGLAMSYDRSAALATVSVNGRNITFVSTHLASESSGYRSTQIRQLMSWARGFSEQRIIAGDFNAGLVNVPYIEGEYNDGWTEAAGIGAAYDYPGNTRWGATHQYKIDFVFRSENAARLRVRSARVYDTRDADGDRPSDHKPLMVTYSVN